MSSESQPETTMDDRPTLYSFAGGAEAFLAVSLAMHERCVADPVLNHPFSHDMSPEHDVRLAEYLGEVFGGPRVYSERYGGHSAMLEMHASTGAEDDMARRFLDCFDQAVEDAELPRDPEFRRALHDYMAWATREVHDYSPLGSEVPSGLELPHWTWNGLER
ncbi:MAG: oxygen-binding heme protein [Acidimicrobiaceae bacterium]|nr:oxygen-binding heme protein [Acidimicrobiaceae bacterium]